MNEELFQLGLSVIFILFLAAFAWWLRLGSGIVLKDEAMARELAIAAECDFEPAEAILADDRTGALLSDMQGRVMLLRRQGAKFAGRMLDDACSADIADGRLVITVPDRFSAPTSLDLGRDAAVWRAKIENLATAGVKMEKGFAPA